MESFDDNLPGPICTKQNFQASGHLFSRFIGKGDGQHIFWGSALDSNEMGDAMRQGACLTRTGSGHNHQPRGRRQNSRLLFRVKPF